MNTIYNTSEVGDDNDDCAYGFKALASGLQQFKQNVQFKLVGSSAGRIVLHLVLAVATCHFAWHFHGIVRELTGH
jgi:hypothetical protein